MVRRGLGRLLSGSVRDDASIPYRVAVAGLVFVSVLAAVLEGAVDAPSGIAALVLVPAGFVLSYHRRAERNLLLKTLLAAGLFLAFGAFLSAVRGATSLDDTRAPLVAVFLWVQVLHSFDVPRARDLAFSIAAGVVLIALAGSLAFSTGFIVVVLVFIAFLVASLVLGHESELRTRAGADLAREAGRRGAGGSGAAVGRRAGALMAASLVVTGVVFVFTPRLPGAQVATLPFSFSNRTPIAGFDGNVVNPGRRGSSDDGQPIADPDAYFGYGDTVDLRVRGRLSDELVMRVRSPRPSLYRAQGFDNYEDGEWKSTSDETVELHTGGLESIHVPVRPEENIRVGEELIQTFYVERRLPNVVFHAYRAKEIFVPSTRVRVDEFSSLRLPFLLEEDTIYSVVSEVPNLSPDELRFVPPQYPPATDVDRYLQLPDGLSERFRRLAREITGRHATIYDKAGAVQSWIRDNKQYRLDIPPDPPGKDPVDVFVFERDEGFCEQIAATMALMLRASGVPTRLVTGFGPGERNLFTGYWEVRNSNAHAWVEVLYPGVGWVSYDPTFGVPSSSVADTTFVFSPIRRFFGSLLPAGVLRNIIDTASGFVAAAPLVAGALLVIVAGGAVSLLFRRRRRVNEASGGREEVVRAWMRVERDLRRRGYRRRPDETALEFARRVSANLGTAGPALERLADAFGDARYGKTPVPAGTIERWEAAVAAASASVREAPRTGIFSGSG